MSEKEPRAAARLPLPTVAAILAARPRSGQAHLQLALAQEAAGDIVAALASYRRAVELDTELAEAAAERVVALERQLSEPLCTALLCGGTGGAVLVAAACPQASASPT